MTEGMAKSLLADFLSDLEPYTVLEIQTAIATYRRDPDNRFFPTPGALIGIMDRHRRERSAQRGSRLPTFRASDYPEISSDQRPRRTAAEILAAHGKTPLGC